MVVRRALVLTLYVCALSPAHAHRVPECHTTVQVTGESLEIVHRLHLHDVVRLLEQLDDQAHIDRPRGRAMVALHVEQHFAIASRDDQPFSLRTLGAELEGRYFYVYQDYNEEPTPHLVVRSTVFRNTMSNVVNTVRVISNEGSVLLSFQKDDGWKSVEFTEAED